MLFSTVTLLAALTLTVQDKAEIKVEHVSARYIYDLIKIPGQYDTTTSPRDKESRGLLPDGVEIAVTEGSNSITAVGSRAGIRELERIIPMFDKKPRSIDIDFIATAPAIGRDFRNESTVFNNTALNYSDRTSDTLFNIVPRINGDGTVTLMVTGGTLGHYVKFVARIQSGQVIYGLLLPQKTTDEKSGESKNVLTFRYTTIAIDPYKFLSSDDPMSQTSDWFFTKDISTSENSLSTEPPVEAEFRFIVSTRIR